MENMKILKCEDVFDIYHCDSSGIGFGYGIYPSGFDSGYGWGEESLSFSSSCLIGSGFGFGNCHGCGNKYGNGLDHQIFLEDSNAS